MFKIYHSNQLASLKEIIIYLIKKEPLSFLFEKEIILIQNFGFSQWLQIELAKQLGVVLNIDYQLPSMFIWNMFHNVLLNIPKKNYYTKQNIKWTLLSLLPKIINQNEFKLIKYYIQENNNNTKIYQISNKLANLFEKYLIFRPELIKHWENDKLIHGLGNDQLWTKKLWQKIIFCINKSTKKPQHIANLYKIFIDSISKSQTLNKFLPKRIFIFGISSLPPIYIQILNSISKHTNIYLMFVNPCRYYLNYLNEISLINRLNQQKNFNSKFNKNSCESFNYKKNINTNNNLLNSCSKIGYEYLYLIFKIKNLIDVSNFIDTNKLTLLENLKQDILDSKNNIEFKTTIYNHKNNKNKRFINSLDKTITFHSCHSIQREIEILHDNLLSIFEENKSISPKDVLIMTPNIENYVPYINAIFNNIKHSKYIPFSISDRKILQTNPILKTFLMLLNLPESRFSKNQVFLLLEDASISAKFNFNENDLNLLYSIVEKYGIRWGLDNDNFYELKLPNIKQNSWKSGLKRMLSDYNLNGRDKFLKNILPNEKHNETIHKLIYKLTVFIDTLRKWKKILNEEHIITEWKNICQKLINDFFLINITNENIIIFLIKQLHKITNTAIYFGYKTPIKIHIIHDELLTYFNKKKIYQDFLTGGVNFCTFTSTRSIPFKVIGMLGMNDTSFPRKENQINFDLTRKNIVIGDIISQNKDRYFFLETLISTKNILYISYIGRSIYDNKQNNPSILIEELLDYICHNFCLIVDKKLNIDINSNLLREHLIIQHSRTPFDKKNFIPQTRYQSYADEWLLAAKTTKFKNKSSTFLVKKQKTIKEITIEQLLRFYRHPIKFFFQQRLNVNFFIEENKFSENEPFIINNLQTYKMNKKIIKSLIKNKNPEIIYQELIDSGKLPVGCFGRSIWEKNLIKINTLIEKNTKQTEKQFDYHIKCIIKNIKITGVLKNIYKTGILRYQPSHSIANNIVQLWIEHLFFNFLINNQESALISFNKNNQKFPSIEKEIASHYIEKLITGYCNGQNSPLIILNNSCWNWLEKCFNKKTQQYDFSSLNILKKARISLIHSLQGNQIIKGEIEDFYLLRIHRNINNALIQLLIKNAKEYLLPIGIYLKKNQSNGIIQ
ncbi:RecBCD enzyme subunit RecC [Candidatus Providencia siddallii]|uniref:RecBCD enzyme subunit RecC n=1 Tax=Candidatus Providencia siddallii TaxID=1715285 RepID=A0A0M6W9F4_9GAMM|nr:RecBCD enzyme subunit RecC [Candidatus Providencia siddallii]